MSRGKHSRQSGKRFFDSPLRSSTVENAHGNLLHCVWIVYIVYI